MPGPSGDDRGIQVGDDVLLRIPFVWEWRRGRVSGQVGRSDHFYVTTLDDGLTYIRKASELQRVATDLDGRGQPT